MTTRKPRVLTRLSSQLRSGVFCASSGDVSGRASSMLSKIDSVECAAGVVVVGVIEARQVVGQHGRCAVLEHGIDEDEQALGCRIVRTRHFLQQVKSVVGDVGVLMRQQAKQRRHTLGLDEDWEEVRLSSDGVQRLERLVELQL